MKPTTAPIRFNNTVLRDGHQSLPATRMTTAQMLRVAPLLDRAGFAAGVPEEYQKNARDIR